MNLIDLKVALDNDLYETARRIGLTLLAEKEEDRAEIVLLLHDALVALADFKGARDLLEAESETLCNHSFQSSLRLAQDLRKLANDGNYRTSVEARQGFTIEEYLQKYRKLTAEALEQARRLAQTAEDEEEIRQFHQELPPPAFSRPEELLEIPPRDGTGILGGRIMLPDGSPAAMITVTLGLETVVKQPDTAKFVSHSMHSYPRVGRLRKLTVQTDSDGYFVFTEAPAGSHEFLAVTLDPTRWEIPTRFIAREIIVVAGREKNLGTYVVTEWQSAEPLPLLSPHPEVFWDNGVLWIKVREWKLRNPFFYEFPRQLLTLPVEDSEQAWRIRIEPDHDEPFQLTQEGAALLMNLPAQADKVIALYSGADASFVPPTLPQSLRLNEVDNGNLEIETGVCSFRLAGPKSPPEAAPLQAVRGQDGVWRGHGRFRLPPGVAIEQRTTRLIEQGPLLITVESSTSFSNGCSYNLSLTALAGEPLLLIRECSGAMEGASFDFSLKELSGGRGYLHWNPETGSLHWSTLNAEDKIIGQLPESVPWWIPPQGFGYAMTADGLHEQDYIGVFTRRRGEWIDREFEKIAQGPIDEDGQENRELEWPHPEMVGSSISMITVHTSCDGDAFYRFGFFDGERQWGLLVSTFAANDGPWKEFGRLQHAYSSPRLQEFKDWHFDVPDPQSRPHLVARRNELVGLRKKTGQGGFVGLWRKIQDEAKTPGPRDGLVFALDNDPLLAWEKRILLNYIADNRSTMTLLGRDWSDMYSPVGGRNITKWAEEYDLIAASGVFTPEEERRIRDFFILMGHMYIEEDFMNWRFNGRNANFEADRTDIVGAVGLVFQGHPDSGKFLGHVLERTRQSLLAYCTPRSGRWYENPACYYLHASKCRINLVFHLAHKGLVDLESIPRLKEFLRWGILLLTPPHAVTYSIMRDGGEQEFLADTQVRKVPPIGDHAGIGKWLSEHYAYLGKLFLKSDPAFGRELMDAYFCSNANGLRLLGRASWENNTPESEPAGTMTSCVAGNLPLLFCNLNVEDLPANPVIDLPSRRLEGFGAVFRSQVNTDAENYLLVKQGPGGYRYHRTEGSFLLFSEGRPLVFDGGEAGETWRHSTLSFHDIHMPLSPARVERHFDAGGFQFIQGAHPVILSPGEDIFLNDSCRHELVNESYRRYRLEPPAVARAFAWVDGDYLIVHDDLTSSRPELSHWHVQVVGGAPRTLAPHDYLFPGRFGVDLRVILPDQTFEAESTEQLPILHYSGTPESWFAMQHLQLSRRRASHYLAVLKPVKQGACSRFHINTLTLRNNLVGAAVQQRKREDLLWFCRSGLAWENESVRFEGSYGALLKSPDRTRLILIGKGTLQMQDVLLVSDGPSVILNLGAECAFIEAFGAGNITLQNGTTTQSFVVFAELPLKQQLWQSR